MIKKKMAEKLFILLVLNISLCLMTPEVLRAETYDEESSTDAVKMFCNKPILDNAGRQDTTVENRENCCAFFKRHPEAIGVIKQVIVVSKNDSDSVASIINDTKNSTLFIFPQELDSVVADESIKVSDFYEGLALFHPSRSEDDALTFTFTSTEESFISTKPKEILILDGISLQTEGNLQVELIKTRIIKLHDTSFRPAINADHLRKGFGQIRVKVYPDDNGLGSIRNVLVDCSLNTNYLICLESCCYHQSSGSCVVYPSSDCDQDLFVDNVDIRMTNTSGTCTYPDTCHDISSRRRAYSIKGLPRFNINGLNIINDQASYPVEIRLPPKTATSGCLSNVVLDIGNSERAHDELVLVNAKGRSSGNFQYYNIGLEYDVNNQSFFLPRNLSLLVRVVRSNSDIYQNLTYTEVSEACSIPMNNSTLSCSEESSFGSADFSWAYSSLPSSSLPSSSLPSSSLPSSSLPSSTLAGSQITMSLTPSQSSPETVASTRVVSEFTQSTSTDTPFSSPVSSQTVRITPLSSDSVSSDSVSSDSISFGSSHSVEITVTPSHSNTSTSTPLPSALVTDSAGRSVFPDTSPAVASTTPVLSGTTLPPIQPISPGEEDDSEGFSHWYITGPAIVTFVIAVLTISIAYNCYKQRIHDARMMGHLNGPVSNIRPINNCEYNIPVTEYLNPIYKDKGKQ